MKIDGPGGRSSPATAVPALLLLRRCCLAGGRRSGCAGALHASTSSAIPTARSRRQPDAVVSPADGRVLVAGERRRRRRRPGPGSRSASSCRRWTCTSTAFPLRGASRAWNTRQGGSWRRTGRSRPRVNERNEIWHRPRRRHGRVPAGRGRAGPAPRLPGRPRSRRAHGRAVRPHEVRVADRPLPAAARDAARGVGRSGPER